MKKYQMKVRKLTQFDFLNAVFQSVANRSRLSKRTSIRIECFYAQVEMVADPTLLDLGRPLEIQQKNIANCG